MVESGRRSVACFRTNRFSDQLKAGEPAAYGALVERFEGQRSIAFSIVTTVTIIRPRNKPPKRFRASGEIAEGNAR